MSEKYPNDLRYSDDHEWVRRLGDGRFRLGVTWFAQDELGDVVFVELPEVGSSFARGDEIGTIESVKAVAELFTPLAGEVVAVNEALEEAPERVNQDPYGEGWLVELRTEYSANDEREMLEDAMMDAAKYAEIAAADRG